MRKKTHEEYEQQLLEIEAKAYPLEKYRGNHTPILHACIEDHTWHITPGHVLAGVGCPTCAGNRTKTDEEYKNQIKNKPFINIEPYYRDYTKILHKCSTCTHEWSVAPSYILQGTGCPMCNTGSFKKEIPGIVYFVSLEYNKETIYKFGITNQTVKKRFKSDWTRLNMQLLWQIDFDKGADAFNLEQKFKREHSTIKGIKPLRSGGNTELVSYTIENPHLQK